MNPLLTFLLAEIVKQVPQLAIDLVQILGKPAVTDDDWDKLKSRYSGKTYDDYIAAASKNQASPR
jgi:hypothetical protein